MVSSLILTNTQLSITPFTRGAPSHLEAGGTSSPPTVVLAWPPQPLPTPIPVLHPIENWPPVPATLPGQLGSRLSHFLAQWSALGTPVSVLDSVWGLTLEFSAPPPHSHASFVCDSTHGISIAKQLSLHCEVCLLLHKSDIERTLRAIGFHAWVFLIPKKKWKLRPMFNMKHLNRFIVA